jgi:hypothetical protein
MEFGIQLAVDFFLALQPIAGATVDNVTKDVIA